VSWVQAKLATALTQVLLATLLVSLPVMLLG
jgi:hypothetical protein